MAIKRSYQKSRTDYNSLGVRIMAVNNCNYYHNTSSSAFHPMSSTQFYIYYFFLFAGHFELGWNTRKPFFTWKNRHRKINSLTQKLNSMSAGRPEGSEGSHSYIKSVSKLKYTVQFWSWFFSLWSVLVLYLPVDELRTWGLVLLLQSRSSLGGKLAEPALPAMYRVGGGALEVSILAPSLATLMFCLKEHGT